MQTTMELNLKDVYTLVLTYLKIEIANINHKSLDAIEICNKISKHTKLKRLLIFRQDEIKSNVLDFQCCHLFKVKGRRL